MKRAALLMLLVLAACTGRSARSGSPIATHDRDRLQPHAQPMLVVENVEAECRPVRAGVTRTYETMIDEGDQDLRIYLSDGAAQCLWGAPVPLAKRNVP